MGRSDLDPQSGQRRVRAAIGAAIIAGRIPIGSSLGAVTPAVEPLVHAGLVQQLPDGTLILMPHPIDRVHGRYAGSLADRFRGLLELGLFPSEAPSAREISTRPSLALTA